MSRQGDRYIRRPRTPKPGRSMGHLRTDLAREWHPVLNGVLTPYDVMPGSAWEAWWRCSKCQHVWQTRCDARNSGNGCPACRLVRLRASRTYQRYTEPISQTHPAIAQQWHPSLNGELTPDDVTAGVDTPVWWLCDLHDYAWQAPIERRARGVGCLHCGRERQADAWTTPRPGESLADEHPTIATEWHPTRNGELSPTDVRPSARTEVWWLSRCGHEWRASCGERTLGGASCPDCSMAGTSHQEQRLHQALSSLIPDIHRDVRIPRFASPARNPWRVDIAGTIATPSGQSLDFVVEFDGEYWHGPRNPRGCKQEADRHKADDIRAQGYTVIRVREGALAPLHHDDVWVPLAASADFVAARVLDKLVERGAVAPSP